METKAPCGCHCCNAIGLLAERLDRSEMAQSAQALTLQLMNSKLDKMAAIKTSTDRLVTLMEAMSDRLTALEAASARAESMLARPSVAPRITQDASTPDVLTSSDVVVAVDRRFESEGTIQRTAAPHLGPMDDSVHAPTAEERIRRAQSLQLPSVARREESSDLSGNKPSGSLGSQRGQSVPLDSLWSPPPAAVEGTPIAPVSPIPRIPQSGTAAAEGAATGEHDESKELTCMRCNAANVSGCCAGCNFARYCSIECQRVDWSSHKTTCQQLGVLCLQYAPQPPPLNILVSLTVAMEPTYASRFGSWVRSNHEVMCLQAACKDDEESQSEEEEEEEEQEKNTGPVATSKTVKQSEGSSPLGFDGPRLISKRKFKSGGDGNDSRPGQARIFVGGLPAHITESSLTSLFSKYGTVLGVYLSKQKLQAHQVFDPRMFPGAGFVRMADKDAVRAIAALNHSRPFADYGRYLEVRIATADSAAAERLAPALRESRKKAEAAGGKGKVVEKGGPSAVLTEQKGGKLSFSLAKTPSGSDSSKQNGR